MTPAVDLLGVANALPLREVGKAAGITLPLRREIARRGARECLTTAEDLTAEGWDR